MGTFQKFCLRWNNHTSNLLGTLGHILASAQHSDVTLCCQGEVWRLHKLVLCASSSHFEKLLSALPPGQTPIVVLDGPHPQDVASLIHFIYHGEVNVDQENLGSLLRTAESLKIKGLAEVSSVTSSHEHKSQCESDRHRLSRARSRPSSEQNTPVYTIGNDYPLGMYNLVSRSVSPQNQVPDPLERDPSPLNLSFNGTLKNIHDETPQERQERRNRLDDLLYAATERSKKEERREARKEAREAALREAAAVRDSSVIIPNDISTLPPATKRPRTSEPSRSANLHTHPAFHIPLMNLTVPPSGIISHAPPSSTVQAQSIHSTELMIHPEPIDGGTQLEERTEPMEIIPEIETTVIKASHIKCEKAEVSSNEISVIEELAANSDESDTQSAPETPSDLSMTHSHNHMRTPSPTNNPPVTHLINATTPDDTSPSSGCGTPMTPSSQTNSSCGLVAETGEEKVTPYFHSILRQVAEGGNGGEVNTTNAQRVTINMRTFKEEWRRQLLVDYDTRTNMSICMLCFTTFKSYDGPRKNTYVKHAKRFHPSLEEYSEEERDLIIGMYEKYHKYDVDMQKEVNKSYRAANAIVALGKKGAKHCDITAVIAGSNGLTSKPLSEADPQEMEKPEPILDMSINIVKEEEPIIIPSEAGKSRPHTPDSEISIEAAEKLSDTFESDERREKVENNNISTTQLSKRSPMNTRAKSAATTTVTV